jgi:hypothetical protein
MLISRLLVFVLTLVASSAITHARTAGDCAPYEIPIQLDFTVVTPEPVVHTATAAEIRVMTDKADGTGVHESGITVAETLISLGSTSFAVAAPGSTDERITGECVYLETVKAVFGWRAHDIYVASDYAPGSCLYSAVLRHEQEHAAINTAVLRAFAPRMRAALDEALAREKPLLVTADSAIEVQNAVARLDDSVTATLAEFQQEKARRNAEIDAYENRVSIMRSCAAPAKRRPPRVRHYME